MVGIQIILKASRDFTRNQNDYSYVHILCIVEKQRLVVHCKFYKNKRPIS